MLQVTVMTEADENLRRMFANGDAPERDLAFADEVQARVRDALRLRLLIQTALLIMLVLLAVCVWLAARLAASAFSELPLIGTWLGADILGAPVFLLILAGLAASAFYARRFFRPMVGAAD